MTIKLSRPKTDMVETSCSYIYIVQLRDKRPTDTQKKMWPSLLPNGPRNKPCRPPCLHSAVFGEQRDILKMSSSQTRVLYGWSIMGRSAFEKTADQPS